MKVQDNPTLSEPSFRGELWRWMRDAATQINLVSEGRVSGAYNADTAAPTAGTYRVGDFVRNSSISELGSAGSKYILTGWYCTAESPLAFREARVLTGN